MIKFIALQPHHITAIQLQRAQAGTAGHMTAAHAKALVEAAGVGWAAVGPEDGVIACAGIVEMHQHRGLAWAMFSDSALARFKIIHRVAVQVLSASPWRRVEMHVDCQHAAGCRWAERLGFRVEGVMQAVTPDGRDCFLYARVR